MRLLGSVVAVVALGAGAAPAVAADATFAPAVGVPGALPVAVTTGDFDDDGKLDFAFASESSNALTVRTGDGAGGFTAGPSVSAGARPTDLKAGDFDGDGDDDLVSVNTRSDTLGLVQNTDGGLGAATLLASVGTPTGAVLADFNEDGDLDIASSNRAGTVRTFVGAGNGTFAVGPAYNVGAGAAAIAAGDLDRDGDVDLVAADGGGITVLRGAGNGTFAVGLGPSIGAATEVTIADVSRDGIPDIVTVGPGLGSSPITVLFGAGDATFTVSAVMPAGDDARDIVATDFNGDGAPDLVTASNRDLSATVYQNSGTGTFALIAVTPTDFQSTGVAAGDFDRDGLQDFVVGNFDVDTISFLRNSTALPRPNFFRAVGTAGAGTQAADASLVDVNRDGLPDLTTLHAAGTPNVTVELGTGTGTFGTPAAVNTASSSEQAFTIDDMDSNGTQDLLIGTTGDFVEVKPGAGDGTFANGASHTTNLSPVDIATGDFDGDGTRDFVTANQQSADISVFIGGGGLTFAAKVDYPASTNPTGVAVGDLDDDGDADLAVSNQVGQNVTVLRGNGDGTFAPGVNVALGAGPQAVDIGDVDRDGDLDVMADTQGGFRVLANDGSGSFTVGPEIANDGFSATSLTLADIDVDARLDVLLPSFGDDLFRTARGNGDGSFQPRSSTRGSDGPFDVTTGDIDRDGYADAVTANLSSGDVAVFLGGRDTAPPVTTDDVPSDFRTTPATVTLTPTDADGSGVKTTYFETGATPAEPTTASAVYDPAAKPSLGDAERIRYFSVDEAGNAEAPRTSAAVRYDLAPPTTTDDVPAGFQPAPFAVTLTRDDAGGSGGVTTYFTTGTAPADPTVLSPIYDPANRPVLADGERIKYFSADALGNEEAVRTSAVAKVDATVPDTTISSGPSGTITATRPSVAFETTAVDATFECAVDGGAFAACTSPFQPDGALADGPHVIRVRAVSRSGIVDASPAEASFTVDTAVEQPTPATTATPTATATPSPGPQTPTPAPTPTPVRPPVGAQALALRFSVTGRKRKRLARRRGIVTSATCVGTDCALVVSVHLRGRPPVRLRRARLALQSDTPTTVRVKTSRRMRRQLRSPRRRKLIVRVVATGPDGQVVRRRVVVRLKGR